jgi:hypothetical protein
MGHANPFSQSVLLVEKVMFREGSAGTGTLEEFFGVS